MKFKIWLVPFILILLFSSCQKSTDEAVEPEMSAEPEKKVEPERITVQHILIAFQGTIPVEEVTRTQEEALTLAQEILERARSGEDFDSLVKEFTDDQHPGIYKMSNTDVPPKEEEMEYSRTRMVKAFGDVSFSLAVGEIGLAEYDPETSKYGWHIIKRLE
jgi:parvulin-like peptidyl-prolyl isomerase